jgi:hypothetical protein
MTRATFTIAVAFLCSTAAAAPLVTFEPPYAVIRVFDEPGNVIETQEHASEFKNE